MEQCIVCKKEFSEIIKRSDEHIIPEFLGGSLTFKDLCSDCNSKMGRGFEGRLSKLWLFEASRYIHKIPGKNGLLNTPIKGTYDIGEGTKIRIDKDGKAEFLSSEPVKITPKNDMKEVNIQIRGDSNNKNKLKQDVIKRLERYATDNNICFFKEKKEEALKEIENIFNGSGVNSEQIKNPVIPFKTSFCISDINLLYIKIAYEMAFVDLGASYLDDTTALELAQSLKSLEVSDNIDVKVFNNNVLEPFKTIFSGEYHYVFFHRDECLVSIYGFFGIVKYLSNAPTPNLLEAYVHRFCYKTQTHKKIQLIDMVYKTGLDF